MNCWQDKRAVKALAICRTEFVFTIRDDVLVLYDYGCGAVKLVGGTFTARDDVVVFDHHGRGAKMVGGTFRWQNILAHAAWLGDDRKASLCLFDLADIAPAMHVELSIAIWA